MQDMQSFIIGIVIVAVTLVIGIFIIATIQGTFETGTAAFNAAGSSVTALAAGVPWITILVVVGFAVIVLGMLTSGFSEASRGAPVY